MYLVDSNVFIEAKNRYYGFDIAPGFWDWLDGTHAAATACSIEPVRVELVAGDDELATWAAARGPYFRPIDGASTRQFPLLTEWANSQGFTPGAIAAFTSTAADYYLVAYAKAHGDTVVTLEKSHPESRKKIFIPDACLALGVPCVDTFAMMRATGGALMLRSAP